MAARTVRIRQDDIARAVAGVEKAGKDVERVDVDLINGRVTIHTKGATVATGNPWDDLHR